MTNLQGVPYDVHFLGEMDHVPHMSMHGDYLHFALGDATGLGPAVRPLQPGQYDDPEWKAFSQSALATGAFPIGLAARTIKRTVAEYTGRQWPVNGPVEKEGRIVQCGEFRRIPPDFPDAIRDKPDLELDCLFSDGGMSDNEPLDMARRIIDGDRYFTARSPGDHADRALIAIAPFPDLPILSVGSPPLGHPFLLTAFTGVLASAINQSRFDPKLAFEERDPTAFHRYTIAPSATPWPTAQEIVPGLRLGRRFRRLPQREIPAARLSARPPQLPAVSQERLRAAG